MLVSKKEKKVYEKKDENRSYIDLIVILIDAEREELFLFNNALDTFYLYFNGIRHMERGNTLPPLHELLFFN